MPRIVNVACIGDSLTDGGYPQVLQELLRAREPSCDWRVHNCGVLGAATKEWLQTELASSKVRGLAEAGVDVYCVMLGTNDAQVKMMFDEQQYRERLTQIGRALTSEGAAMVLISPPPVEPGGFFTKYIDVRVANTELPRIVPEIAKCLGCGCADAFSALGGAMPNVKALLDGVHLTPEGNRLVANAVVSEVLTTVMRTGGGNSPMNTGGGKPPMRAAGGISPMRNMRRATGSSPQSPLLPLVSGAAQMLTKASLQGPVTPGRRMSPPLPPSPDRHNCYRHVDAQPELQTSRSFLRNPSPKPARRLSDYLAAEAASSTQPGSVSPPAPAPVRVLSASPYLPAEAVSSTQPGSVSPPVRAPVRVLSASPNAAAEAASSTQPGSVSPPDPALALPLSPGATLHNLQSPQPIVTAPFPNHSPQRNDAGASETAPVAQSQGPVDAEVPETCPKGHPLTAGATASSTYWCDRCSRSLPQGAATKSCRLCDYDVCENCTMKVFPSELPGVAPPAVEIVAACPVAIGVSVTVAAACPVTAAAPSRNSPAPHAATMEPPAVPAAPTFLNATPPMVPLAAPAAPASLRSPPQVTTAQRKQSQLEASTPSVLPHTARQSQSNGYSVGEPVEVFSNTFDAWFFGRIVQVNGTSILTEFVAPDGRDKEKWMPIGHPQMRLVSVAPVVQAQATSPMSGATPRSPPNGAGLRLPPQIASLMVPPHGVGFQQPPGAASVGSPMNGAKLGLQMSIHSGLAPVRSPPRGVDAIQRTPPVSPAFKGQVALLARSGSQYPSPVWGDCRSSQKPPVTMRRAIHH